MTLSPLFSSVDPAPPLEENNTAKLQQILLDETLPLFTRYRAMFSLRNKVQYQEIRNAEIWKLGETGTKTNRNRIYETSENGTRRNEIKNNRN